MFREEWTAVWNRVGAIGDPEIPYRMVLFHLTRPNRFYHNENHVLECYREFEPARNLAENPDAIELNFPFHDAVMNFSRNDNEERSARLMLVSLKKSVELEFLQYSASLILSTKHIELPQTIDEKLETDVDLSILGQSEEVFEEYENNIRRECHFLPENVFAIGRAKFLKERMLSRKYIYSSNYFREKYEEQARKNLKESLRKWMNLLK